MIRKATLAAALAAAVTVPVGAAYADPPPWAPAHGKRAKQDYAPRYYTSDNGIRYWRGDDGRYRCRRGDGTVGLLIGGAAGALIGREIDSRGSRTTGTVLGAAAGALLGREVARGGARCR